MYARLLSNCAVIICPSSSVFLLPLSKLLTIHFYKLWNIGNQMMAVSVVSPGSFDSRLLAADVFAASHDFSLMSEEEEGKLISKDYLDYDVKFDPTKAVVPNFHQAEDSLSCDISSEVGALDAFFTSIHIFYNSPFFSFCK